MRVRNRRWLRLIPLALLALLVAPGTWWRDQPLPPGEPAFFTVRSLQLQQPRDWPAGLRLVDGWVLSSRHPGFGGYSALLPLPGGRLLAYSDRGDFLAFPSPAGPPGPGWIGQVPRDPAAFSMSWDFEAATRDPRTGRRWLGVEGGNGIRRLDAQGRPDGVVQPRQMRHWPRNQGPEALVRLPDGRFIVLAEGSPGREPRTSEALLFASDPVEGGEGLRFRFPRRGRYRPTDMAVLPDGRVVILQRSLTPGLPPFGALLAVADPATIRQGEPWRWQELATLTPALPRENYEGLAITPAADGGYHLWVISDDNQSPVQRTLLLQLHWTGR
ncbi:esterase-like activity of phytase family protein [Croceibacterium mercuriale]|uniref:esterase-like activity of phytase family protein n=1 Tax=Croceibacterium mercuriale TaxID=1572751 RepID=UPI00068CE772|nr:esterase-like activity of phytase family protein [Croceibacterium mercuriale]